MTSTFSPCSLVLVCPAGGAHAHLWIVVHSVVDANMIDLHHICVYIRSLMLAAFVFVASVCNTGPTNQSMNTQPMHKHHVPRIVLLCNNPATTTSSQRDMGCHCLTYCTHKGALSNSRSLVGARAVHYSLVGIAKACANQPTSTHTQDHPLKR
jgi:hypothetical protein